MTPDETRAYMKAYRETEAHRARKREQANAWNAAHPEERHAKDVAYREAHREEVRARGIAWTTEHPEKNKANKAKYREANRERIRAKSREAYAASPETRREYHKAHYKAHREERRVRDATYRLTHREEHRAWCERNKKAIAEQRRQKANTNPEILAARRLKRRAAEQQAMPVWANQNAIRAFYLEAARLTRLTGIKHEVDHIYPIQGRTVCGLHWEANLQVLPLSTNRRKFNTVPAHANNPPATDLDSNAAPN